jgi:hypothetical protein
VAGDRAPHDRLGVDFAEVDLRRQNRQHPFLLAQVLLGGLLVGRSLASPLRGADARHALGLQHELTAVHRKPSVDVAGAARRSSRRGPDLLSFVNQHRPGVGVDALFILQAAPHSGQWIRASSIGLQVCLGRLPAVEVLPLGVTHSPQCGHGNAILLCVPCVYSCQIRPVSTLTVHSATVRASEPNASRRRSSWLNLSPSRLLAPDLIEAVGLGDDQVLRGERRAALIVAAAGHELQEHAVLELDAVRSRRRRAAGATGRQQLA